MLPLTVSAKGQDEERGSRLLPRSAPKLGLWGASKGVGCCTPIGLVSALHCRPTLSQVLPVAGQMLPSPPELFLPVAIFNRPAKGRGTQPPTICSDSWDAPRAAEPGPRRVLPGGSWERGSGAFDPPHITPLLPAWIMSPARLHPRHS